MWLGPGGLLAIVILFWALVWLSRETTAGRAWFDILVPFTCLILGTGSLTSATTLLHGWTVIVGNASPDRRELVLGMLRTATWPMWISMGLCGVFLLAAALRWRFIPRAPSTTTKSFQVMSFLALFGMMAATAGGVLLLLGFFWRCVNIDVADITADLELLGTPWIALVVVLLWGGLVDAAFWGLLIFGGRAYRWRKARANLVQVAGAEPATVGVQDGP